MSSNPGDSRQARHVVSPLLQLILAAGIVVWIAATVVPLIRGDGRPEGPAGGRPKEQMVYMMNPSNSGNLGELGGLIAQGWRITHVSSAGSPQESSASHRFLMVIEHPTTKVQDWWFVNPYSDEGTPPRLAEQLKSGSRITHVSAGSASTGGGWTYRTVFVLER
jgi:hypothetical protein